ncbi:MAG: type VI secretion system baseplate subunit TssG [Holosporaceae bacterium]|jgi:type VI secretion system ImpH/TssG family protein|nr:type VI secretion system baseplate subunit TssG [Holosporaceae bacterium]
MEAAVRHKELSLNESLQLKPHQFSFETAAYILEHGSKIIFGDETNVANAPFKTRSINSFYLRGTEIEKISQEDGIPVIHIERLSLAGLNAPLPTPYAELIFRRTQEQDVGMEAFINTFNTRLLGISCRISRRRHLNLQRHDGENCLLLKTIAAFSGDPPLKADRKMSRLSYLFWTKEKSAAGLEAVLSSFLKFTVKVKQIQTFWADRRENHPLGTMELGRSSELGKRISISSFGVEICLTHLDFNKIFCLITDEKYLNEVRTLIRKYLGDFFCCTLSITPPNLPPLKLGRPLLGKTSWIPGKIPDPVKIIC